VPDDFQEEFDSPQTLAAIAGVLKNLGHEVRLLGDGPECLHQLLHDPPELVFNFAEGQGIGRSREARLPAVLEILGIPYTGSDPLTLAVTLDKDVAKRLVASAGVPVPGGVLAHLPSDFDPASLPTLVHNLRLPLILKPVWEGSSKGIRGHSLVDNPEEASRIGRQLWADHRQPVLIEEFIQGDEVTVGMIGNDPPQIVGIMRVFPKLATEHFIYGLEVKRDYQNQVRYECPAQLPSQVLAKIQQAALSAWQVLGCRDVARLDFRIRDGVPYFLEANPLPGLHPQDSDLIILGRHVGWDHARIVGGILQAALKRYAQS
jgi:D-alanine-D-alanine ligase